MKTFNVTIRGLSPLLLHPDDIEWADYMDAWRNDPRNKKTSRAGDDRSPAWRWVGNAMNDGEKLALSSEMVARSLMEGGAQVPVPGARGNKTFKSQTQSGMMSRDPYWTLLVGGKPIPHAPIKGLMAVDEFSKHREAVRAMGFDLLVKRAKVGTSKHIRVRPMFREWQAVGALVVWDEQLTESVLRDILGFAGRFKGLGDWRPGGRTPGSFGMYEAEVSLA